MGQPCDADYARSGGAGTEVRSTQPALDRRGSEGGDIPLTRHKLMQTPCVPCSRESADGAGAFRWNGGVFRLALGLLCAGQSMVFSLAVNVSPPEEAGVRVALQGLIFAATMGVVLLLGAPLFRTALAALARGRLTIEILFLTTIVGALLASLQSFITGEGPIYFEVVSVLLVVYTFGNLVTARTRNAALAATQAWSESLSVCRRIDPHGDAKSSPVSEIRPGDV